jgi:hypothetical protein
MFSQYLSYIVGMGGIVLISMGYLLVWIGGMVDRLPTEKESGNKTLARPGPSTKIATVLLIIGYVISSFAIMDSDRIIYILGIVGMISVFMFTFIIFSFAVYNVNWE